MLELRSSRRVVDNIIKTFARCSYSLNFIKTAEATFSTLIKHLDLFYARAKKEENKMGGCCTCVGRKGLWYVWAFNALIASIFSIIAVSHGAVFDKIIVNNKSANSMLDGAIACISCSVFLNIGYLVTTALILLRKTIALNGAGAAFGFMIALSLMMFFNQIQVYDLCSFLSLSLSSAFLLWRRNHRCRAHVCSQNHTFPLTTGWILPPIDSPVD